MQTKIVGSDAFHLERRHATLFGLAAILLWSTTVAVARSISEQIGPVTAALCIYSFGALFSMIINYLRYKKFFHFRAINSRYLLVCGSLFVLYMTSLYLAVGHAQNRSQFLEIGLINYLWPVLTVLFSIPLLKKSASLLLFPGLLFALTGIFLVTTQGKDFSFSSAAFNISANPFSYSLALIAAVTWATYSNLSRRLGASSQGGVTIFMLATALVLLGVRATVTEPSLWSSTTVIEILYMATASTLGYFFWDIGMRKGDFVVISTASYFTPLASTIVSCLYLDVVAGVKLWIGCALLITGAYLSKISVKD